MLIFSLKKDKSELCNAINEGEKACVKLNEKLSKANEIIKLLLWDLRNRSYQPLKDIERAEQFLKESE